MTGAISDTALAANSNTVTAGLGAVLATDDLGTFYWLDGTTGEIARTFADANAFRDLWAEARVGVGESAFWAGDGYGTIGRIEPGANAVTRTNQLDHSIHGLSAGEGALWAITDTEVGAVLDEPTFQGALRIDRETLVMTDSVAVRSPSAVAAGAGAAWVTGYRDGTVVRINPVTAQPTFIEVGGNPTGVAVGADAVWVTVSVG
jgi:hypothetical protein